MLQISIPFAGLSLCLRSLPRRPCRLLQRKKCRSEGSLHRSFFRSILMKLPTVFTVSDQEQGIKVVTGLMKTQRPFAELLERQPKQIEELEKFSDEMLDKLSGDIEEESKK